MKTRRCQAGLWGSSPLTLFFHGRIHDPSPNLDYDLEALNTDSKMQKAASGFCAKLAPNSSGAMEVWKST